MRTLPSISIYGPGPRAPAERSRRWGGGLVALGILWTSGFATVHHFVPWEPEPTMRVASAQVEYSCPMQCGGGRRHARPGRCPVCGMELVAARGDRLAHTDHTPKHGGQFFMALDKQHHLEGTLVSPGELRIYLYDEFTLPLDPQGYTGELTVQATNERGAPRGDVVKVTLLPDRPRSALVARLPASLQLPCDVEAWLRFPRAAEPELFNFHFAELRHAD